ncbi:ABC transporter ATP-binding protein, partial [Streptomyces niveus]
LQCLTGTPELTEPRAPGHQVRCVNPVLPADRSADAAEVSS